LAFVIHFQRPNSLVAYYQQVGRAGRMTDKAYGIILAGKEDDDIHHYFINHAFPNPAEAFKVLDLLAKCDGMALEELHDKLDLGRTAIETALRILEVDGAIIAATSNGRPRFSSTKEPWKPDYEQIRDVTRLRQEELEQMRHYIRHRGCLMEFLARALDDVEAHRCGVCANCQGRGLPSTARASLVAEAVAFLIREETAAEQRALLQQPEAEE
jgi:ATP-dependent DNA helicase RecQ